MKALLLALIAASPLCGIAQPSPSQPIRLTVGYAAGGSVDMVARKYAIYLQKVLNQTVVVENRGGASGVIAANAVKSARPDGSTVYFVASPTLSITPAFTKTAFHPVKDFAAVGSVVKYSNVLLVNSEAPFKTVEGLLASGGAQHKSLSYGSAGVASSNHLSGALLAQQSGVDMVHVPYQGNAPAVLDLIADRITFVFDANNNALNQINAGHVRPLAVTSAARNARLPEVPTMVEAGFGDFRIESWIGLVFPAGAAQETVDWLARANQQIIANPNFIAEMEEAGYEMDGISPEALSSRIEEDFRFYSGLASTLTLD